MVEINGDSGVVGFRQGKLVCFVCGINCASCRHLNFVNEQKHNTDFPAIRELFEAGRHDQRQRYRKVCLSTAPIKFDGDESYMAKVNSRPRDYLNLNQVLTCNALCTSCGTTLENGITDVTDAVLVSEFEVHKVAGKFAKFGFLNE